MPEDKNELNANDIPTPQLEVYNLRWGTDEDVQNSINALFQCAEAHADGSIRWYARNKTSKAWMSRILRFIAILLTTLGGLTPIVSALGWTYNGAPISIHLGQYGYLFLGLAAACVGVDKFFGLSSGWMRYITTMMTLERALSVFRFEWAMMLAKLGDKRPTPDQIQLLIQRIKEFLLVVDTHVEQETQAWVAEFRTSLSEIEKTAKTQSEATKPGAIDITVTNGMDTDGGFTVTLDGMEIRQVRGTKYQIGYVPPGPHKIGITGAINGEELDASELVNVAPGAIAGVTIALPVKEAQP